MRPYTCCDTDSVLPSGSLNQATLSPEGAVQTPSVALFGPKDPRTYGPYNPLHRVIRKGEIGQGSMDEITVDDAFRGVQELLGERADRFQTL